MRTFMRTALRRMNPRNSWPRSSRVSAWVCSSRPAKPEMTCRGDLRSWAATVANWANSALERASSFS